MLACALILWTHLSMGFQENWLANKMEGFVRVLKAEFLVCL